MITSSNNLTDELLVILVLFKCTLQESEAFQSLSKNLEGKKSTLFIYDNSPSSQVFVSELWNIIYVHDPSNPGVSKAYNEGFKKAKELGKKWLMLVDQDTEFPAWTFKKYGEAILIRKADLLTPILSDANGIVSPLKFSVGGGQRLKNLSGDQNLKLMDYYFHNSGLLVSVENFERAGMYDENLPLDFSDFSFVHRLRSHCHHFFVADVHCNQKLASTSPAKKENRLARFKSYVSSGKYFQKKYQPANFFILVRIFFRAIKLTLHYKDYSFVKAYFN